MILNQKETTVAYRCPKCGGGVISLVGAFTLSADMLKLKCPCGESEMTITYTPDNKVRLDVPCAICGQNHNYLTSKSLFFSRDIFMFNCAYTGMDICFVGKREEVERELARTERELLDLMKEAGLDSLEQLHPEQPDVLPDAQIYDIVRFIVRELEADGELECDCPAGKGDYDVEITEEGIRVFCSECGCEHIFPADSVSAASDFLRCDHLRLDHPATPEKK